MRLLVVCLGNICRSPMAEGLIRARIEASPLRGRVDVDSAGTGDWHVGQPPDRRAISTARRHGIEIGGQRARELVAADGERFDWLLCADGDNLDAVRRRIDPSCHPRAERLLVWAGIAAADVPDPYTGDERAFERVWALLDAAADGVVARLLAESAAAPRRSP
ncbi:low molecular weight protein-tyrosine-phosphatase [Cognatilysobacter tabacisoli]|uniref:low molecular weight protein-tyrosine-phosphatase n=1 Tax=Cognatilysobacter tabacisoli TaxID=2315424 RepID=UPI000E6B008C|nr:low molecular weight protein-tyrosine-phosphatase [Lysobacter tabacisoli]